MRNISLALLFLFSLVAFTPSAHASDFGRITGIVHDPAHRPIHNAAITVRAAHSELTYHATSNADGAFTIAALPLGEYIVTVASPGFATMQQAIIVSGGSTFERHFQLQVATVHQSATVETTPSTVNPDSVTPTTLIDRVAIARTPGADRTNSLAMITDYVPGAYITHDMLHMRGGHELSWLIDGVEIPNTNIASNVGPQIDPKDIDTLEVERGSYDASLGDRTYGVFNVVPRTGFERNRSGELVLSAGSFYQTNDQISLGNHTEKFAWYVSANGNRSNYGLQPAISKPVNDASNGAGAFTTLIYNHDPNNQLRFVAQARSDYYQIPKDPNTSDWESAFYSSSGLSDAERENDSYAAFTWVHTFNSRTVSQVSPFFHFNQANYHSNPNDYTLDNNTQTPDATTADETGNYAGLQASISTVIAHNSLSAGIYGYAQHESDLFSVSGSAPDNPVITAGVQESFLEDHYKPTNWLTLIAGERQSYFTDPFVTESAYYPRVGIALQIPRLNWVFRAFYGHFYQPPPVTSISGSLLSAAQANNDAYVPLKGERNEEHQFGVQIPFHGWLLDADTFQTEAHNFLDHNNIGESSVFIPITVQGALVQAWELTLRSPHLWHFGQAHLAYSNQIAQQTGGITGGLTCEGAYQNPGAPCYVAPGYSALDHDQRNTLNVGFNGNLPLQIFGSFNVYYGSGFSNGDTDAPSPYTGAYLPSHTTVSLALGRNFGRRYTVSVDALNAGNTRVLLDNSLTFGGFHYNDPRQIYAELRYRFKF